MIRNRLSSLLVAAAAVSAVAAGAFLTAAPAAAKNICGWYAIIHCSPDDASASAVANRGWGSVLETQFYSGLRPGLFCVASGPQSKASARRDRQAAIDNGYAGEDAYIKRACVDDSHQAGE